MTIYHATIRQQVTRTVEVSAVSSQAAREMIEAYGVDLAFSDFPLADEEVTTKLVKVAHRKI